MKQQGAGVSMRTRSFHVRCDWDPEASVWYVAESDVPGLSVEAPTMELMQEKVLQAALELIELNMPDLIRTARPHDDVPLSLVYHRDTNLKLRTA